MRVRLTVAAGAAALSTAMLVTVPNASAAAAPVGNTCTKATITWFNRSIRVVGEHTSVSAASCRGTTAFPLAADSRELGVWPTATGVCGASEGFVFTEYVYAPGGAASIRICLDHRSTKDAYPTAV